jgi:hypothetical protein
MTELLEQAITKLKTLPASEQDAMAALILEELGDEILWGKAFEQSQQQARSSKILANLEECC